MEESAWGREEREEREEEASRREEGGTRCLWPVREILYSGQGGSGKPKEEGSEEEEGEEEGEEEKEEKE